MALHTEANAIKFEQLRDCERILLSCDNRTVEEESMLREIKELVRDARFRAYCSYNYELLQVVVDKKSKYAKIIMHKYFPAPKYDPGRESRVV